MGMKELRSAEKHEKNDADFHYFSSNTEVEWSNFAILL